MIHSNLTILHKPISVFYYNDIQNFGDVLNEFIIAQVFGAPVLKTTSKKADVVCIGSLLESFLVKKHKPWQQFLLRKPIKVWGTGFIADKNQFPARHEKLNRKVEIYAVRGKHTLERIVGLTGKVAENVALGDPGL